MMRFAKKLLALMLVAVLALGTLSSYETDAKEISIATPKVTVKMLSKSTGVKIAIGKTKDADGYEVSISGTPADSDYCSYFKYKDSNGDVFMRTSFTEYVEKNGKAKRSIAHKDLQPGTYIVKVRSWNNKKYGTKTYSEWSKEKTFTIKESATNGYSTFYDLSKAKKGDVVKFGAYEQDLNYTNGKEPIEWIVIEKTKKSVLLLSKYALDRLPYHKDGGSITWEKCTLRKWLNSDFIKSAFNKTEQGMIKTTTIENFDNAVYKTPGGNDTKDKVFLMSQLEMINSDYGFSENYDDYDVNRRCAFAWYKNKKGSGSSQTSDGEYTCWWWLRSPGGNAYDADEAAYVRDDGYVHSLGNRVDLVDYNRAYSTGVRPALYINLK